MKINGAQLEAFFMAAKHLNFTKAASALHVTQSALSQRIAKLEEELETTLFIRDRTTVRLTEAANHVLRFCQTNELGETELLNKLKGSNTEFAGAVRIGGFSSVNRYLIIPSLEKLMGKNPKLSIQLLTKEIGDLDQLLRSAEVDYIITNKKSEMQDIESIFLGYEENVLVQSQKSSKNNIYLDHDEKDPTTKSYFRISNTKTKGLTLRYLDDVYGLIEGVKFGYGRAVLPLHLIREEKNLEVVNPQKILRVSIYLQFYTQPYYRKIHFQVVEDIQKYFRANLKQS